MTPDELLRDHQSLHSTLQMDAWILTEGNWTDWGRYQQALRELHARRGTLESLLRKIELAKLDLAAFHRRRPWFGKERQKRWSLHVQEHEARLRDMIDSLAETHREHRHFYQVALELKARIGDVTPEKREQLDRETWMVRIQKMVAIDAHTHGRIGPAVLKMIASLPVDLRRQAIEVARNPTLIRQAVEAP